MCLNLQNTEAVSGHNHFHEQKTEARQPTTVRSGTATTYGFLDQSVHARNKNCKYHDQGFGNGNARVLSMTTSWIRDVITDIQHRRSPTTPFGCVLILDPNRYCCLCTIAWNSSSTKNTLVRDQHQTIYGEQYIQAR